MQGFDDRGRGMDPLYPRRGSSVPPPTRRMVAYMIVGCAECEQAIVKANIDLQLTGSCTFWTSADGHSHAPQDPEETHGQSES